MEFKNTWTRIAARWNDEDQNKVNIDVDVAEFCGAFEYHIGFLANQLTQSNFVNDRVKKISDVTFNVFESNGTYYILTENGYDISDDVHEDEYYDVSPHNINELIEVINNINKYMSKYNLYMNKLINDFQQSKNNKVKNYKIVKELEKFKNTVNQFYQLLNKEYSNIEKFEPFYIIINKESNELLDVDLHPVTKEEDVKKYYSEEDAKDNMKFMAEAIYEQADEDEFKIILINSMKQYDDILKKYGIK